MKREYLKESILELFLTEEEETRLDKPKQAETQPKEQEPADVPLDSSDLQVLAGLEQGIEKEINRSIDLEAPPTDQVSESSNQGGFAYENQVIKSLKKAGVIGNIKSGAGANAAAADADIKVKGQIYNIEVKLDRNAQMGGSSVRFGKEGIFFVKPMPPSTEEILRDAIASKSKDISALLSYISKQRPASINKRAVKFPLACTKDAWEMAARKGLLVNTRFRYSSEFISKHYAKKGIFYIQIGGSGLFYLSGNPANLPVPKLQGDINIEIRSARGGSKKLKTGVKVVGGGIRVQARLKSKGQSPFTLDDPKSVAMMVKAMKAAAKKKPTAGPNQE